jgi:Zn-dependent protease with chaperone function
MSLESWPWTVAILVIAPAAWLIGWSLARLSLALAFHRLRSANGMLWTERARRAWSVRKSLSMNLFLLPLTTACLAFLLVGVRGSRPPAIPAIAGLATMAGVLAVSNRVERRLATEGGLVTVDEPTIPITPLFIGPPLLALGVVIALMPMRWSWNVLWPVVAGALLMSTHLWGLNLWILARRGWLRPASPRLADIVDRASRSSGIRPRQVYEIPSAIANAFAWPRACALLYTTPMLRLLDDGELEAVTRHELGHLSEPVWAAASRVILAYSLVLLPLGIPLAGSFGLLVGLIPVLMIMLAFIAATSLSRAMERRSDAKAIASDHGDPAAYARALELIHRASLVPAVLPGKRSTHPHLYDRMIAAGVTPDYPRPDPPPTDRRILAPTLILYVLMIVFLVVRMSIQQDRETDESTPPHSSGPSE